MKKNVLALSITAGMLGLGFAGGAQAMSGAPLDGAPVGSFLSMNKDGIGHMLMVPYYTAQAENSTLINITNTDTVNAKAVKVRFRAAANSDDVFDFQVFLSPGDVYAFSVSKDSTGNAKFTTNDASCTKPSKSVLNTTPFVTSRLDTTKTGDALLNQAREGYVEIFNMADIPRLEQAVAGDTHPYQPQNQFSGQNSAGVFSDADSVNDLYAAIKHVNKVAPCTGSAWSALDTTNPTDATAARTLGLLPPSTGLMANWTVINVVGAAAWSGAAASVQSVRGGDFFTDFPSLGNVVYWPQTANAVGNSGALNYTADPLFRTDALRVTDSVSNAVTVAGSSPAIAAAFYDLPDMSTPYTFRASDVNIDGVRDGVNTVYPLNQARNLTETLASTSITNEFLTDATISATTDWVFSMPTRRYSVALNYAATGTDDGRRFSELVDDAVAGTLTRGYFIPASTTVSSRQICVYNIGFTPRDREESEVVSTTDVVISPSTPGVVTAFCGEASILSVNNGGATTSGALKANVAVKDLTVPYTDGWMAVATPAGGEVLAGPRGLPVIGASFVRALGNGTQTFGAAYPHRNGRGQ